MSNLLAVLGLACVVLAMARLFNDRLGLAGILKRAGVNSEHGHRFIAFGFALTGAVFFHLAKG